MSFKHLVLSILVVTALSSSTLSAQWLQIMIPAANQCTVPIDAVPYGAGKIFYSSACKSSSPHWLYGSLHSSADDFKTEILRLNSGSSHSAGDLGFTGLKAYNDSTFLWFEIEQGDPTGYFTRDNFKSKTSTGIKSAYGLALGELTPHSFYSIRQVLPQDTFFTFNLNLSTSKFSYSKTGGYNPKISKLSFINDSTGFMIVSSSKSPTVSILIKTDNYGKTWLPAFVDSSNSLVDFKLVSTAIYLLKSDGQIFRSLASPIAWTLMSTAPSLNCTAITSYNANVVLVGTQSGTLFRTLNAGVSWNQENVNANDPIKDIYTFGVTGYFVTQNRSVFRTDDIVGVKEFEEKLDFNIYPNPSTGVFNLNIPGHDVSQNNPIRIHVSDILGNRIYEKKFFTNEIEFSLEAISSGVYFIDVQLGNRSHQKLIQKVD